MQEENKQKDKNQTQLKKRKSEKNIEEENSIPSKPQKYLFIQKDTMKDIAQKLKIVGSNLANNKNEKYEHAYDKIRNQLEFYFGDSNLFKDKFLRELIQKNQKGYVDITIFLNFNKIKEIVSFTNDTIEKIKNLVTAVESSHLLKLNKEKTKVKRRLPFKFDINEEFQKSVDKRTVYVENFPEETTHEKLAKIFSQVGNVLHVSLPKYNESKTIKGFAFLEFSVLKFCSIR